MRGCRKPTRATPSSPWRAKGCMKSRSARCTRASSSPGISASRWSASACCASSSAWATRTRASKSASSRCRSTKGRASPDGSRATAPWRSPGPTPLRSKAPPARSRARALWLRALLLERERIANHLGDLGYLGNDGGLAFGLAQFSRLKEDLLRSNAALFGHRYLMDRIVPGGVAVDVDDAGRRRLLAEADRLEAELRTLRAIYYDHAGLQDRCINCGHLAPGTAAALGVVGLAARASGHAMDARVHPGFAPYDEFAPRLVSHRNGDVAARIVVRFEELLESLQLERRLLQGLPPGAL